MKHREGAARYAGLDALRGLAAFGVVLIHTPAVPSDTFKSALLDVLPPANAVFAIMAGYFMLAGLHDHSEFPAWFKSRLHRLVIPYLIWTGIYVLLNVAFDIISGRSFSIDLSDFRTWFNILVWGAGATQLWFLPTLFYAQIFLFCCWAAGRKILAERYLLALVSGLGICSLGLYPTVATPWLRGLTFMIGYVFLGGIPSLCACRLEVLWPWAGVALAMLVTLLGGILDVGDGIYAVDHVRAVLWVLLACTVRVSALSKLIHSLGTCSMGIYLVHIVFLGGMHLLLRSVGIKGEGTFYTLALASTVLVVSWAAVLVLRKIRIPGM